MATSKKLILVESSADQDHISDLQRSIGKLSTLRNNFSQAHEIGHLALEHREPNRTGMVAYHESLKWLAGIERLAVADWLTAPSADAVLSIGPVALPLAEPPSSLSPWQIRTAIRMFRQEQSVLDQSFEHWRARPPGFGSIRVLFRGGSLLADSWIASLSLIDSLLRVFHCMMALRVAISRRPGILTFVLLLLAVCLRYGRREEPDDHAFLPIRRYQTSLGAARTG